MPLVPPKEGLHTRRKPPTNRWMIRPPTPGPGTIPSTPEISTRNTRSGTTARRTAMRGAICSRYLPSIRFICLAMTGNYIENHFDEIIGHESEIESRLIGSDCTIADFIDDNERYINGFQNAGERIVMIDSNYALAIRNALCSLRVSSDI